MHYAVLKNVPLRVIQLLEVKSHDFYYPPYGREVNWKISMLKSIKHENEINFIMDKRGHIPRDLIPLDDIYDLACYDILSIK